MTSVPGVGACPATAITSVTPTTSFTSGNCSVPSAMLNVLPLYWVPTGALTVMVLPDCVAVKPPVTLLLILVALVLVAVPLTRSDTVSGGTTTTPSTVIAPTVAGNGLVCPAVPTTMVAVAATGAVRTLP